MGKLEYEEPTLQVCETLDEIVEGTRQIVSGFRPT